jgi:hypothetical protein
MSLLELDPVKLRKGYIVALMSINRLYITQERIDEEIEDFLKLSVRFQKEHQHPSQSIADAASQLFQYYEIKLIRRVPDFSEDRPPPQGYRLDLLDAKSAILATVEILTKDSDESVDQAFAAAFRSILLKLSQKYVETFVYENLDALNDSSVSSERVAGNWVGQREEHWLKLPESIDRASRRKLAPSAVIKCAAFIRTSLYFTLGYSARQFAQEVETKLAGKKSDSVGSLDDITAFSYTNRKIEVVNSFGQVLLKQAMTLLSKQV